MVTVLKRITVKQRIRRSVWKTRRIEDDGEKRAVSTVLTNDDYYYYENSTVRGSRLPYLPIVPVTYNLLNAVGRVSYSWASELRTNAK